MAELSSVLFLDTDELGRPTGLVASEDTDSIASAIMPQSVKDTVVIVQDADVSGSYPAWNTVSGVSGLAPFSGQLLALPDQFEALSGDVGDISGEVGALTALGDVSAELLALPSSTSGVSSVVYNNSGTWNEASAVSSFSDISSVVYNNSGTWNDASAVSSFSDISSVVYDNSSTWNNASSVSSFSDISSVVYNNSGAWNEASSVSSFSDISSVVYQNSSTWNSASSVSSFDDVSSVVYQNSSTWNSASSVSSFDDVSSVVYQNSSTWNSASSVSGFDDVSSVVYNNSGTWNDASGVSAIDDVSGTVYNNSGTWNDASSVSGFSDVSSVVYNNSGTWNDASSVSGFSDVSSVVYDNSSSWNEASAVSSFSDISSVVYDNSSTWNSASSVSGFDDVSSVVYDNSSTWNSASAVSSFSDISSVVYQNSSTWNSASSVSGFEDVSSVVYQNSSTWNSASSVSGFEDVSSVVYQNSSTWNDASSVSSFDDVNAIVSDGSGVLSSLSGVIPGNEGGPDVPIFSALSALADRIRVVDTVTGEDAEDGQTIYLSGASRITTRAGTAVADLTFGAGNEEIAVLKLQNSLDGIAYLSGRGGAGLMAPASGDIWMAFSADGSATQTSSLRGLYKKTSDSSGNWDGSYEYVTAASGDIKSVSGSVFTYSGTWNDASGVSGVSSVVSSVIDSVDADTITLTDKTLKLFGQKPIVNGDENVKLTLATGSDGAFTVEAASIITLSSASFSIRDSANAKTFTQPEFVSALDAGADRPKVIDVSNFVSDTSSDVKSVSSTFVEYSGAWTDTCSTVFSFSDSWAGGGGGSDSREASAILVSPGTFVDIDVTTTATVNTAPTYDGTDIKWQKLAIVPAVSGGDLFVPASENTTFDFGASAGTKVLFATSAGQFTTSGATKTLLEFSGFSRVALGRNSVPLEISAFGESDVRLRSDNTTGAFVLVEGTDAAPSLVHLKNTDLSADSDSSVTFASDVTIATSSVEDTFAGLSGAITDKVTLSEGNQTITGNRTVDDGNNGYFYLLDMEDSGKKSQVFLNPGTPSVQVVANDTGAGNITGFTAGSTNLNLTFTGAADLRLNAAPGSSGEVLTSNGAGSAPTWQTAGGGGGGGTTVELLSAGFSGTGSIPTSAGSLLTWDAPGLNTASVTYAAGEFTIPAGVNGYYCEINAMAGGDGGNARVELNLELLKDTGSGYVNIAAGDNYAVRTVTQDEGGATINFLDPTAVATGDKYKFQFRRVGGGLNHKPLSTKLTMKFYSP